MAGPHAIRGLMTPDMSGPNQGGSDAPGPAYLNEGATAGLRAAPGFLGNR